ncbi:MAG: YCF48-related protein [Chitinophagaceae bacterium]|nr:YCF48-related protein [Chitinophagaceae bacterium]
MKSLISFLTISLFFPFFSAFHNNKSGTDEIFLRILTTGSPTDLRGLCVVNSNVIWVSGSNGMVGKSTNGGINWQWRTVNGFEKADFRDIEAFDANTAIIMSIGEPGYILKTTDGGVTWKIVYKINPRVFF